MEGSQGFSALPYSIEAFPAKMNTVHSQYTDKLGNSFVADT